MDLGLVSFALAFAALGVAVVSAVRHHREGSGLLQRHGRPEPGKPSVRDVRYRLGNLSSSQAYRKGASSLLKARVERLQIELGTPGTSQKYASSMLGWIEGLAAKEEVLEER